MSTVTYSHTHGGESLNRKAMAAGAAAGVLLAHLSGGLRTIEHGFSPGLARTTFGIFGHAVEEGRPAAKAAIQEMYKGGTGDRVAAKAACAFLNSSISGTPAHSQWVAYIYQTIPPEQQNISGVDQAVDSLARRLAGVTEYRQLYLEACFAKR